MEARWIRAVHARSSVRALCVAVLAATLGLALPAAAEQAEPAQAEPAQAEQAEPTPPAAPGDGEARGPADPYERGTPRSSVASYLETCRKGDFERAANYLDLRHLSEAAADREGASLARQLKVVLDRKLWVDLDVLSEEPEGRSDDSLPPGRDRVGFVETKRGAVPILIQRVPRADGVPVWKFARSTVDRIPALYEEFGYGPLGELLPEWMLDLQVLEVALWQWIALLVLVLVAGGLSWLVALALAALARPLAARSQTQLDDRLVSATAGPVRLAVAIGLFSLGTLPLGLSLPAQRVLGSFEKALAIAAVAWFLLRVVNIFSLVLLHRLHERSQLGATAMVPLGQKAMKAIILLLSGLALLDSFGVNVTALVAGLGVGGIAVALAAQKTIENLFGGVTVLADRPVSVGEFCRFGDRVGTVEEIGLRSTRVRTLDRTLVTVPNADFASMQLENYTRRDKIWYHPRIGLRYETTPDQLRYVLVEVRKMLYAHPRVISDGARIRFVGFGAYSLDLDIFSYVNATDYGEFLGVAEDLNLRVMDIVEASGSGFAFPSQTLYLGKDDGLDGERVAAAEKEVQAWREGRELYLPQFPPEKIQELESKLAFPAPGSPDAKEPQG